MPISRYQIRSEYSLADPELYRAADRDDPEELLEGVAMAGLVGVLRQLGDLSEFAAEIFHELHEEVMATAARGHGLMIRVQQLETEFPSIEKAFLSQTSHSHFTHSAGIEWHANLQMDQNLITQGDLPRVIMDSYEECRGPPRLFLLDKFDVAGAGACLKRYSDPSFYKTELASIGAKKAEVQREKRSRKIKKRGARWRKGDTPEIFSTSQFNSRLHQLDSDEKSKMPEKVPTFGVMLKRRHLNSASFSSRTGRSYMEHILEMHPSENKTAYADSICTSHLKMESNDASETGPEIYEISVEDSTNEFTKRERTPVLSPNREEVPELSVDELAVDIIKAGNLKSLSELISNSEQDKISSTFHRVDQYEVIGGGSKTEASVDGYMSDDFGVDKIPTSCNEKDYASDGGNKTKARVDRFRSDEFEIENVATAIHQVDRKDESVHGKIVPEADADIYISNEFVEKTSTTSHLVCQRDVLVDGESKTEITADGSRSDKLEVENILTTFYQVGQKRDALVDDETKKDATVDGHMSDEFEVEKDPTILHRLGQKDEFVGGESKIDGNANGYMPVNFEVMKKPSTANDDSRIAAGADGYRSDEFEGEKILSTIHYLDRKGASVDNESTTKVGADGYMSDDATSEMESLTKVGADGYMSDDVASEMDNYMDALTTMESEMETDTEGRAKHELGLFNVSSHEMDFDINEEQRELHGQCSDTHSIGNSNTSFDSNCSFKKERSSNSSDSLGNLASMQSLKDNGAACMDVSENFENSLRFKDDFSGPMPDNPCFVSSTKSSYSTDGYAETEAYLSAKICLAEIHDISSEKITSNGNSLRTKSLDSIALNDTGNEEPDSYHMDFVSTLTHLSPGASLNEVQPSRLDPSLSSYVEDCTEEIGKRSVDDLPDTLKISGLQSQITEVPPTEFSESCPGKTLVGGIHDPSSDSVSKSSVILDMPQGTKDNDVLEVLATVVTTECSSDNLQVTEVCELPSGTIHDSSVELAPTGYMEDCAPAAENMINRMLDSPNSITTSAERQLYISIEQDSPDVYLDGKLPPECLPVSPHTDSFDGQASGLVVGVEDGVALKTCSENLKPAVELQEISEFTFHEQIKPTTCILPIEAEHFCCGEPCKCHVVGLAEVPTPCSGSETLISDKSEVFSNPLELERDENLPESHPNSFHVVENSSEAVNLPSTSVKTNADNLTGEDHTQSDDLVSEYLPVATGCNDCCPEPFGSLEGSDDKIQFEEEYLCDSVSNQYEQVINESTNHEDHQESDAQKIHAIAHSENAEVLPESDLPDCSESPDCFHHLAPSEDRQAQLQLMGDPEAHISLKVSNQESELQSSQDNQLPISKSPHHSYTNEGAIHTVPLEQGIELEAVNEDSVTSPHEEGELCESSEHTFQRMESSKEMDPPHVDLQQPLEHEKQMDPHTDHSTILINGLNTSSSPTSIFTSLEPEACIPLRPDHSLQNSKLPLISSYLSTPATSSPIIPSFALVAPEATTQGLLEAEASISLRSDHSPRSYELPIISSDSSVPSTSSPINPSVDLLSAEMTSQQYLEPQLSKSSGFPYPVSNAAVANLEEMPPLPPLPPLEWRIGKVRHGSPTLGGEMVQPLDLFPSLPTIKDEDTQHGSLLFEGEMSRPLNPFAPLPTIEDERPRHASLSLRGEMLLPSNSLFQLPTIGGEKPFLASEGQMPQPPCSSIPLPIVKDENPCHASLSGEEMVQPSNSLLQLQTIGGEKPFLASEGQMPQPPCSSIPLPIVKDENPCHASLSGEEMVQPSNSLLQLPTIGGEKPFLASEGQMPQPPCSSILLPIVEDENPCHASLSEEERVQPSNSLLQLPTIGGEKPFLASVGQMPQPPCSSIPLPIVEDENPHHALPPLEGVTEQFPQQQAVEDEKPKGNLHSGLNQPRDPLIEAVASHDRSMLRKASERILPVIRPKSDERNSLLEQIRTKSFNLKPAVGTKPIVQGPKTNLNVVAILEKANAIRQAFAGSDEDDSSDSWSDS